MPQPDPSPALDPSRSDSNRPPWTARVAGWSARHRWPVAALWFVVTIGILVSSILAGGTRTVAAVSNDERAKYEAGEASVLWNEANASVGQQAPASQQFLLVVSSADRTVDDPVFSADVAAITKRLGELQATVDGVTGPVLGQLVDPIGIPAAAGLVSPDRTTVRISGRVQGDGATLATRLKPIPDEVARIQGAYPSYRIHGLNNTLANNEIADLILGGLDDSLFLTVPLTFVILVVAFGAIVAAVIPLVLALTALAAAFGILGLYSQIVSPVSPYASQLVVLIGLAVAVDYSLFMVTRFRTERRRLGGERVPRASIVVLLRRLLLFVIAVVGVVLAVLSQSVAVLAAVALGIVVMVVWAVWRLMERGHATAKLAAIDVASNTAGRAVFFSGLAVMISIGGLFLLDDPLFRSMAVGTIAVVFVAVVGSLTFLPATLAILGDGVNGLRIPLIGRDRREGSGLWAHLVRVVMARPVIAAVATGLVLILAASPVTRLRMGVLNDLSDFPDTLDSVQAVNLINEKWPSGSDLDLSVVVTRADEPPTKTAIERMTTSALAIPGLSGPAKTTMSADGHLAFVSYVMAGGSNDVRNRDIVREMRSSIVPTAFGGLTGVRALVSGEAAYTVDVVDFYARGMPLVMAFVLTLSFLLLLVAFRSIVIPIKAILLNLLSTGAAFGLLVLVFQDGWLHEQLGFKPGPIESFIPVFVFTILFGLSMDYHVFILTRIKEARDHGMSSNEAVARGISITSGTVTSAAAIMVVVFAVFVTLELTIIKQLGFGLSVAVFLDATIVRSVLLPATMRLLGEWNWWLPSWLGWLPHVTIEGDVDEDEFAPAT
ncbi:MAG TPA: MMPL family transporter [Verrucomicrobiae bacterium]|nr:MMPL family transporter [Verrucomicrobiae bacterium]